MKTKRKYNPLKGSGKSEAQWYKSIVQNSLENKFTLVNTNLDRAINIFSRYDDIQGLNLIANNTNISENYRNIAGMQIKSTESCKEPWNLSHKVSGSNDPNTKGYFASLPKYSSMQETWRNESFSDYQYNGGFVD